MTLNYQKNGENTIKIWWKFGQRWEISEQRLCWILGGWKGHGIILTDDPWAKWTKAERSSSRRENSPSQCYSPEPVAVESESEKRYIS